MQWTVFISLIFIALVYFYIKHSAYINFETKVVECSEHLVEKYYYRGIRGYITIGVERG